MKLALSIPDDWEIKYGPKGQQLALRKTAGSTPDAILTFGELILLPDEQRSWIEHTVRSELPTGATVKVVQSSEGKTETGWPMRLVEVEVFAPKSDQHLEIRLCAFYAFLEHAAVVIARTPSRARMDAQRELLLSVLRSGRPAWMRAGQPNSLSGFWNIGLDRETPSADPGAVASQKEAQGPSSGNREAEWLAALAEVDAALMQDKTPARLVSRGRLCAMLKRWDEAVSAYRDAVSLGDSTADTQRLLGDALGRLGRDAEASAAWQAALAANPDDIDSLYNLALAQYHKREYAQALGNWQRVFALDPKDFLTLRKIVQAQYALGQTDEAEKTRATLVKLWQASEDPRAKLLQEYVLDQFQIGPYTVHALETVRPRNPGFYSIYSFRLFDSHGHAVPFEVVIETSDYARQTGVPYVLGMKKDGQYKALATSAQLPSYPEIKASVSKLIQDAAPVPHSHSHPSHPPAEHD